MAILSKYLRDFMDSFSVAFQSGSSVQTTAVAIAIISSLCCSILLLFFNLISAQSEQPKNTRATAKLRSENKDRSSISRQQSMPHLRGSPRRHTRRVHSTSQLQTIPSQTFQTKTSLCLKCCVAKAHKWCQKSLCDTCCYGDRSWCYIHQNKPISIEDSAPKKMDLSEQNLVQCPERIGYSGHQLKTLLLAHNLLTALPAEFGCLRGLSTLDLSHNQIEQLPESFGNLSLLEDLRLDHNRLSLLPYTFQRLQRLMILQLDHNNFTTFPAVVCEIQSLDSLFISHNKLESLPESICNVSRLYVLDIACNPIQTLPDKMDNMICLQCVRASSCQLTSLPDALCSCVFLKSLDVSHNKLTSLPPSLGCLHDLSELRVNDNQLQYLPMSLKRVLIHADLKTFSADNNSFIDKEDQDIFLKRNSPSLLESSSSRSGNVPVFPTLLEWCAKAIVKQKIDWRNEDLPVTLKDTLSGVRHCHQCLSPMFDFYCQHLDFSTVEEYASLPFYECICSLHQPRH